MLNFSFLFVVVVVLTFCLQSLRHHYYWSLNLSFLCQHMWPLLKAGGRSETGRGFSLVANMSARVSSIGDNGLGGWHSYRASKTALNQCK